MTYVSTLEASTHLEELLHVLGLGNVGIEVRHDVLELLQGIGEIGKVGMALIGSTQEILLDGGPKNAKVSTNRR